MKKRFLSLLLALLMLVTLFPTAFAAVGNEEFVPSEEAGADTPAQPDTPVQPDIPVQPAVDLGENFCRPSDTSITVRATSSGVERTPNSDSGTETSLTADKVIDGDTTSKSSRWSSDAQEKNKNRTDWIQIDLGTVRDVGTVKLFWERNNVFEYNVKLSETELTDEQWDAVDPIYNHPASEGRITVLTRAITLTETQRARYVRVSILSRDDFGEGAATYFNATMYEIEVYASTQEVDPLEGMTKISTLPNVTATASGNETNDFTPGKAIDGDMDSRWSSANNTETAWIIVDLHRLSTITGVRLRWQRKNVTAYTLDLSADGRSWQTMRTCESRITSLTETFTFMGVAGIRYIRLNVTGHDDSDVANYSNVSLYEVEIYGTAGDLIPDSVPASTIAGRFTADHFAIANGKLTMTAAGEALVPENYTASFGVDPEQIVGADKTIYTPLVDTTVKIEVTVTTSADTGHNAANPISFTIPGERTATSPEGNAKPTVVPGIAEWYSSAEQGGQNFTLTANSRILASGEGPTGVAAELKADAAGLFDLGLNITSGTAGAGDVALVLATGDAVAGFDDETYKMEITDKVVITAKAPTGLYWGTRTLLQVLKLNQAAGKGCTFPCGTARDYPAFRVRGFVLDVGRKPMSMDKLREMAKNMAWYKMNDFHVHLNDNLIFMEDYKDGRDLAAANDDINKAYSAFRLENDLEEEPDAVASLSAKDYHYTKEEYKSFVEDSAKIGVNIVSEIDVPAHAKAITDAFPSVRLYGESGHPWNDHLDLTNKYDDSLRITKAIFDQYIDEGVFGPYVHFGADEYYDSAVSYRHYMGDMIDYLKGKPNVTVRAWGSLSHFQANQDQYPTSGIDTENVQMNVWDYSWANPTDMYNLGFDIINTIGGYIVPQSGTYGDKFGSNKFQYDPNHVGNDWLPASSPQMLGGAYAIWNDCIDTRANGIDEQDIFERFFGPLPYYACALWGRGGMTEAQAKERVAVLGYAPNTNPTNQVERVEDTAFYFRYTFNNANATDDSGNGRDLALTNATLQDSALSLKGGASYAEIGLDRLTWGDKLTFKVKKLEGGGTEQVIFEGDHVYGDFAITALPVPEDGSKWKLGFSRELYDFVFEDALLPVGEWVTLTLTSEERTTSLLVEGDETVHIPTGYFRSDKNSNTQFRGISFLSGTRSGSITRGSSFSIPVARIGSKTNAFRGLVDNVYAAPISAGFPAESDAYDIPVEQYAAATDGSHQDSDAVAAKALDNDVSTLWHAAWHNCPVENCWIQIELETAQPVSGLRYLPRAGAGNGTIGKYDVLISEDGQNWTTVVADGTWPISENWKTASFPATTTKYIRLWGKEAQGSASPNFIASAAELRICRPIRLSETTEGPADGAVNVFWEETSYPLVDGKAEPVPTVTFNGNVLTQNVDYTVSYTNNTAKGTGTVIITGKDSYVGTTTASFTITAAGGEEPTPTPPTPTPPTPTPPTPSAPVGGGNKTTTDTLVDGAPVSRTTDRATGTVTAVAQYPDGSVVQSKTTTGGQVTAQVTLPAGVEEATVIVPTQVELTQGKVAVIVHPDGREEIVKTSVITGDGMQVTLSEGATLRLVDNTKTFLDVPSTYWANEAVTFTTSREIFNGTGGNTFTPTGDMSRAMVCTVLANLEGEKTSGGATWYEKAVTWAQGRNISDGSNPNQKVTREQLVSMIYRYCGAPATNTNQLYGYRDGGKISDWAREAMSWALENGVILGKDGGALDPLGGATRAEVAVVFQRLIEKGLI